MTFSSRPEQGNIEKSKQQEADPGADANNPETMMTRLPARFNTELIALYYSGRNNGWSQLAGSIPGGFGESRMQTVLP